MSYKNNMIEQSTLALALKMGAMALFAAIAHALNQYRTGGAKTPQDALILGFISFFFGTITGLMAITTFGENNPMFYGIIGLAGWIGVEMSSVLTKFIINKFK